MIMTKIITGATKQMTTMSTTSAEKNAVTASRLYEIKVSTTSKSDPNLDNSRPLGVVSKKDTGA